MTATEAVTAANLEIVAVQKKIKALHHKALKAKGLEAKVAALRGLGELEETCRRMKLNFFGRCDELVKGAGT